MLTVADLFDLSKTEFPELFTGCTYAWEALSRIKGVVEARTRAATPQAFGNRVTIGPNVIIGDGTELEDGAMIKGPAIIGRNCQIRHNAYIREHVIVGDGSVVGNACELKNSVLFNGCQVPHFNYVGDSILGYKAHLGAGVILSNVKSLPGNVTVDWEGQRIDTGLRKFGALLGDTAEVGCNAVLNPGSIIGRGSVVYPTVSWRGVLSSSAIAKHKLPPDVVVRRPKSAT